MFSQLRKFVVVELVQGNIVMLGYDVQVMCPSQNVYCMRCIVAACSVGIVVGEWLIFL